MVSYNELQLIWSIQHQKWWKDRKRGYTSDIRLAGCYPLKEAEGIVKSANIVKVEEVMISLTSILPSEEWETI